LAAIVFDLYIIGEDYSVKRIGEILNESQDESTWFSCEILWFS
jgi:hypothetical protein